MLTPLKRAKREPMDTIGFRAPPALIKRLRRICEERGYVVSGVVLRAVEEWVAKMERAK